MHTWNITMPFSAICSSMQLRYSFVAAWHTHTATVRPIPWKNWTFHGPTKKWRQKWKKMLLFHQFSISLLLVLEWLSIECRLQVNRMLTFSGPNHTYVAPNIKKDWWLITVSVIPTASWLTLQNFGQHYNIIAYMCIDCVAGTMTWKKVTLILVHLPSLHES